MSNPPMSSAPIRLYPFTCTFCSHGCNSISPYYAHALNVMLQRHDVCDQCLFTTRPFTFARSPVSPFRFVKFQMLNGRVTEVVPDSNSDDDTL